MNTQVVKTANQPPKPTIMSASSASASRNASNKSSAPKEIICGETFNPDKDLKYSKPKANSSGGKSVGILNASTNGATYISTPLMLTWGVSTFEDKKTGEKSYSMSLQFPGEEYNTPAISKFRANIEKFENKELLKLFCILIEHSILKDGIRERNESDVENMIKSIDFKV